MPAPVGPVEVRQLTPETPVIDQVPVPVGVCPPVLPVTVAVNVKFEPSAAVGELVVTTTIGVLLAMLMESAGDGPTGL